MRVLFIGDATADPVQRAVALHLPDIRDRFDLVIANGENAAGGKGLNKKAYRRLRDAGVDLITLGNHAFDHKDVYELIETEPILRAANYPPGTPGREFLIYEGLLLFQLMGRIFVEPNLDSPFQAADRVLQKARQEGFARALVDVHAETTSEKHALGYYLDGRVDAVIGTHTHVPTADARTLKKGTLYISDVGMTGTYDSIIGGEIETFLARFLTARPQPFRAAKGPASLLAVELELTPEGRTLRPYRWDEP